MRFSSPSDSVDPEYNPFADEYIGDIVEAVALAWGKLKHPRTPEIEDRITFRLAGRLQNDPAFADLPFDVVPQYWLLGIDGRRLGRLDLRFKHRNSQRDYFAFESKRLHVSFPGGTRSPEYSVYAKSDGMLAFVEGQYSKSLPAAGMLGYVMDGNTCKAWSGLRKAIDTNRIDLKLASDTRLRASLLLRRVRSVMPRAVLGETEHDLETHSLRLFHLILPVACGEL